MKKYDERETLFSRLALKKNSKHYKEFYQKNPQIKRFDDTQRGVKFRHKIRKSERFKELFLPITNHNKKYIKNLFDTVKRYPLNPIRTDIDKDFSANLKEITKYYGATTVGITKLTDHSFYSHFGGVNKHLNLDTYNDKIKPQYKTAIVFTILMDKAMINRGPQFEELLATEEAYIRVANVGSRLAMYLKDLGYKAMFNNSEYYLGPLVPLAVDAGLGEIGMCNHLITKEYGNNVRLGAVFTTLEIDVDHPINFGLTELCKKCALCLTNCPSRAITHKPRIVNGRQFYKFDENKCYGMWLKSGTDCGTCISSCPFTQGVDQDKLAKIKENPSIIGEIMEEHYNKHGRRVYQKEDLDIVKLKDDKRKNN